MFIQGSEFDFKFKSHLEKLNFSFIEFIFKFLSILFYFCFDCKNVYCYTYSNDFHMIITNYFITLLRCICFFRIINTQGQIDQRSLP